MTPTPSDEDDHHSLGLKCVEMCHALANQRLAFKFSLKIGRFSFNMETAGMRSTPVHLPQKKAKRKSPGAKKRDEIRRREFLKRKEAAHRPSVPLMSRTSSPLWLTWELVIRPMLTSQVQKPLKRTLWKTTPKTSTYELKKVPLEPGASHLLFLAGTVLVKKSLNAEIVTNRFCWTINVMKVMMKMMRMSLETIVMILIGMRSTCATMKPWNVSAQCIPHSAHHNLRNQEIHGANIRT